MLRLLLEHDPLCEAHAACVGLQVEFKVDTLEASGVYEAFTEGAKQHDPVPSYLWGQRFGCHLYHTRNVSMVLLQYTSILIYLRNHFKTASKSLIDIWQVFRRLGFLTRLPLQCFRFYAILGVSESWLMMISFSSFQHQRRGILCFQATYCLTSTCLRLF